ncbi:Asp-tRNA(Asn)/Glu-tRNA(Gln) amidotransferase subunit GatC [Verrucomicrobiota bacterium]
MANTDKIDVAYVARLARLYLTEEERAEFQGQLEQVVEYVRKIGDLDLEGIEPTSHAHLVQNVLRRDETRPGLEHEQVMENAPASADGQFSVPKIIE